MKRILCCGAALLLIAVRIQAENSGVDSLQQQKKLIQDTVKYESGTLSLAEGSSGYWFRPEQEAAYYLYTNAEYIHFQVDPEAEGKSIRLNEGQAKKELLWFKKPQGQDCRHSSQPFSEVRKSDIRLYRNTDRSRKSVKDEIDIGGIKLYVWNPERGNISLHLYSNVDTLVIRRNADSLAFKYQSPQVFRIGSDGKIRVEVFKRGNGIILGQIEAGGLLNTEIKTRASKNRVKKDEITETQTYMCSYATLDKESCNEVVLRYDYLDEEILQLFPCEIRIPVQTESRSLGIYFIVGGIIVLAGIIWIWRCRKRKTADPVPEEHGEEIPATEKKPVSADTKGAVLQVSGADEPNGEVPVPHIDLDHEAGSDLDLTSEEDDDKLKKLETELQKLRDDLQVKDAQISEKDKVLEEIRIKVRALQETVKSLEIEKKLLEQANSKLENYIALMDKEMKERTAALDKTREELKQTKNNFEQYKSDSGQREKNLQQQINQTQETLEEERARHKKELLEANEECQRRTKNWSEDKEVFLARVPVSVERLTRISENIGGNVDDQNRAIVDSFDYITSSLTQYAAKIADRSDEKGEWRQCTNSEAELAISKEITDLIKNNSSWINTIARLYCYSRVPEIGQIFEENGVVVDEIDSAYMEMISMLGRYGITIVVPRILEDYYDAIRKKYFQFNNEDNTILRFVGRDLLVRKRESLKIYDMGRVAYMMNGVITKGEIVYF